MPYELCLWAAMHCSKYRASCLTRAVRSNLQSIWHHCRVDFRPGHTYPKSGRLVAWWR